MARRKKKGGETISLFPFLSILACTIGVLTLMITALALGQMDNEQVAEIEVIDQADKMIEKETQKKNEVQAELDKQKKDLTSSQSEASELLKKLALKREELEALLAQLKAEREKKNKLNPIQRVDKAALDKRLTGLKDDLKTTNDQIKELEAKVADRKKPPEEAEVQVRPGGSGVDLDPTFVECAAGSIVIFDNGKEHRVRRADIPNDDKFNALLDEVAKKPKGKVILLVRDDGLSTYRAARQAVWDRIEKLPGKLPLLGQGNVDLSFFKPK